MEITDGNHAIALYMGLKHKDGCTDRFVTTTKVKGKEKWVVLNLKALRYHVSWNRLMPVVHKMYEEVSEDDQTFGGMILFELGLATPIEEVWKACVEVAVRYYNEKQYGSSNI